MARGYLYARWGGVLGHEVTAVPLLLVGDRVFCRAWLRSRLEEAAVLGRVVEHAPHFFTRLRTAFG